MRLHLNIVTGAARPPQRFGVAAFLAAILLMLPDGASAQGEATGCRYVKSGPIQIEGFDGPDPFGAQLIIRDGRWVFGPSHIGVMTMCPSCPPTEISKGVLAIGRAPFLDPIREGELRHEIDQENASWLEFALHPRAVALAWWRITSHLPNGVRAIGEPEPVSLWGLAGMARAVEVAFPNRVAPAVAVALEQGCLPLFAVMFRKDEGEVAVADVFKMGGSLGILRFAPERHTLSPAIEFPLGDARKQWEEDRLPLGDARVGDEQRK